MCETQLDVWNNNVKTILTVPEEITDIRIAKVFVALFLAKDEVIVHLRFVLELACKGLQ